jgi:hypothetical protein
MGLENLKVRVKQYPKGWVVEIQKEKSFLLFFKRKYWTHILSVSGIHYLPWYYKSKDTAISEACKNIKWELMSNIENL